jgi:hypothetical protein
MKENRVCIKTWRLFNVRRKGQPDMCAKSVVSHFIRPWRMDWKIPWDLPGHVDEMLIIVAFPVTIEINRKTRDLFELRLLPYRFSSTFLLCFPILSKPFFHNVKLKDILIRGRRKLHISKKKVLNQWHKETENWYIIVILLETQYGKWLWKQLRKRGHSS